MSDLFVSGSDVIDWTNDLGVSRINFNDLLSVYLQAA